MPVRELMIGCGNRRVKEIAISENQQEFHDDAVFLDIDPACHPTLVWDLNKLPLPFDDNEFDEIHAYEVLEHVGQQGDYRTFFAQFSEFYRLLKPGGQIFGTSPRWNTAWAWGDPGHTRVLQPEHFVFLDQDQYAKQISVTPMTDYRSIYQADFTPIHIGNMAPPLGEPAVRWAFVLQAVKPSRYVPPNSGRV